MKKIIVFSILLLACHLNICFGASPTGFMGIAWGTSYDQADTIMLNYSKQILNKENKGDVLLVSYSGGEFNGLEAEFILNFYNGRFYSGRAEVPGFLNLNTPPQKIFSDWEILVAELTKKYGNPTEYAYHIPSYASDSPYLAIGTILNGDGKAAARWIFRENNAIAFEISCRITDQRTVEILYTERKSHDLVKKTSKKENVL